MWRWFQQLDRVLRGEATKLNALRGQMIDVPAGGLSVVLILLGVLYGVCMGCYAVFGIDEARYIQMLASMVKVPALFFLTLLVTFPSLYVFNALVGSRLTLPAVLRLLIAALGINLAVLASLGPIVAFFSVNTESYHFMVLLNVVVFAFSGVLGLAFLLQTLHRLSIVSQHEALRQRMSSSAGRPDKASSTDSTPEELARGESASEESKAGELATTGHTEIVHAQAVDEGDASDEPGALGHVGDQMLGRHVKTVFGCWIVIFGLVGSQMSWVLRPFIGNPNQEFTWFRERGSNFFEAVWQSLVGLF